MELWRRNLYVTWFTQILSLAGFGFMLPFIPFFIQEIGVTDPDSVRRWVGIVTAVPSLLLGVMAPLWGYLADRFGRKLMILRSMAAGVVILFAMSFAGNIGTVLALRMAQGMLTGTVTAAATLVAAGTPRERLSYALGFLASSTFIGSSVGPFIGGITAEYAGYRTAFRIGAVVVAVAFLLVLFFTTELGADGAGVVARGSARPAPAQRRRSKPTGAYRSGFLALLGLLFVIRFSRAMPASFVPLHVQELRGTIEGASAITGIISAFVGGAAALAGLTLSRLGDRHDKLTVIARFLIASTVCAVPLFFTRGILDFGACYVAVAFVAGGIEPTLQSYMSEHTDSSRRGLVFGTQTLVSGLGWSLAPLLASAVSISLGIRWIFLFFALGIGVSWIYVSVAKRFIRTRFQGEPRSS
jgi:MFS transporter, DHA1 family, multidrug resistance protein